MSPNRHHPHPLAGVRLVALWGLFLVAAAALAIVEQGAM